MFKIRNYIGVFQRPAPKKRPTSVAPNFTGSDQPDKTEPEPIVETPPEAPEPEPIDVEIGATFGELTMVNEGGRDKNYNRYVICVCSCSEGLKDRPLIRVREDNLESGRIISCGCKKKQRMWEMNKSRASNVGGFKNGSSPQTLTGQWVEGSKSEGQKLIPIVEGCLPPGAIEDRCPHGQPCSPYVPGRVYGINDTCYRCHSIWGYEELYAEWEKVIKLEHKKNLVHRLDVYDYKHPVLVGAAENLDRVVAKDHTATAWAEFEPGNEETEDIIHRRNAKRTSPPGTPPDTDFED